jgi:hypothetical protein
MSEAARTIAERDAVPEPEPELLDAAAGLLSPAGDGPPLRGVVGRRAGGLRSRPGRTPRRARAA